MSRKAGVTQAFRDPVSGLLHVRGRLRACARLLPCHGLEKESGPRSLRFRQVSVRSPRKGVHLCRFSERRSLTLFVFDFRVHGGLRRWDGRGTSCAHRLSNAAPWSRTESA